MNEEKKDDLLSAFENPATDPTPDIAPVMPEASTVSPSPAETPAPVAQASMDNMLPPELQNAPEPIPVAPSAPVEQSAPEVAPLTAPVEQPAPEVAQPVAPESTVAPDVSATPETPVVSENNASTETVNQDVEPSINVVQTNDASTDDDDPNFLKKNLKFIAIIFAIIVIFIFALPKILEILGASY